MSAMTQNHVRDDSDIDKEYIPKSGKFTTSIEHVYKCTLATNFCLIRHGNFYHKCLTTK